MHPDSESMTIGAGDVASVILGAGESEGPDPARPSARSIACRRCGTALSFDQPEEGGIVTCGCGTINLVDEEA